MTAATSDSAVAVTSELVSLTIDGFEVQVPKGTLIIRAAEQIGIAIPRFCDHPLLDPVGACRQCIVEVEGQRKPLTACTTPVTQGMVVNTQLTSPVAEKAQRGTLELLLINHPLDCPVCDKGGECPLQNQAMAYGPGESRFRDVKRTFLKPIAISSQVLLDRERCVLCARCTRFSQQIAGDPFIDMFERGALQQVAVYADQPFESYFSGNTVQICPVGALTGAAYRFRARPFDLVSTPMVCEHCSSGCALRTDHRRGKVLRRLASDDPQVNEEWNCDKGRWAFAYATQPDRITSPLIRDHESGRLRPASWPDALAYAARGLALARDEGGVGVLPGGRLTVEDAFTWSKLARVSLGTNDIDARVRPGTDEELAFLASSVAGRYLETAYADLESAPAVLLAGFEPEEESPIVFLRLRKAVRHGAKVLTVAAFRSPAAVKTSATLIQALPGQEAAALQSLDRALLPAGSVILVGERLASAPGALSAVAALAAETGAKLAWVPRRAGERGAVDAGALPNLLPGGHLVGADLPWGELPSEPGRDLTGILSAVKAGELKGLIVGGVDPADCPDPTLAVDALDAAQFVVSLELRRSPVTDRADVVFPVAAAVEKSGTYLNWEGRARPFEAVLRTSGSLADGTVLNLLSEALERPLGLADLAAVRSEIARLGVASEHPAPPTEAPAAAAEGTVLATWHWLLDDGSLQDGEPHLAGTARTPRLHLSAATASGLGVTEGELVTVTTDHGSLTLPLVLADLPDDVVWAPTRTSVAHVRTDLAAAHGSVVRLSKGGPA